MFFFVAAVDFVSFASLYDCDFPLQFHRMDSTMRAILCSTMIEGNRVDEREGRSFFYFVFFFGTQAFYEAQKPSPVERESEEKNKKKKETNGDVFFRRTDWTALSTTSVHDG